MDDNNAYEEAYRRIMELSEKFLYTIEAEADSCEGGREAFDEEMKDLTGTPELVGVISRVLDSAPILGHMATVSGEVGRAINSLVVYGIMFERFRQRGILEVTTCTIPGHEHGHDDMETINKTVDNLLDGIDLD